MIGLCAVLLTSLSFANPIHADATNNKAVIELVTIDTKGNTEAYLDNVKDVLARMKELAPEMRSRAFRSMYGGSETGTIYIMNEFPGLAYMAAALSKFENDSEYNEGLKQLRQIGRKIMSESIIVEVTP